MFRTFADVTTFLDSRGLFHMDLSLARIHRALERLKLTQPPCTVVQVIGTNGKGSTSTFLESIARAHGLRTGLFTSPHFVSPQERIMCLGNVLAQNAWAPLANQVYDAAPNLTYFEFLTVLAVQAFVATGVELAVMEAGLGGRFDATSAIMRDMVCITPISLDHEHILGSSVQEIAYDKAMALGETMRGNLPVIHATTHWQQREIMDVLRDVAATYNKTLQPAVATQPLTKQTPLGLVGAQQYDNAALALTAWLCLAKEKHWNVDEERILYGLKHAFLAGRTQHIHTNDASMPPHLLLDGAHNVHSLEALREYIRQMDEKPAVIVFSCLAEKSTEAVLRLVAEIRNLCHDCPVFVPLMQDKARALSVEERGAVVDTLRASSRHLPAEATSGVENIASALKKARDCVLQSGTAAPVLVCGSLYLLGEVFATHSEFMTLL